MTEISAIDEVLAQTVQAVDQSKMQVYDISEHARNEYQYLEKEIETLKIEVAATIELNDKLTAKLRIARKRLAEVSRIFEDHKEVRIREAYEFAHGLQSELILTEEKEKYLRQRRDELELRLKGIEQTVVRAENLMTQMDVITNYLTGDLQQVNELIREAELKQEFGLEIIKAQEEERKRVAREIHDGPAQQMANLALRTEIIERVFDQQGTEKAKAEIKDLREMIRNGLGDIRRIIFNLRPMALDDLGLLPTLTKFIDELNNNHKVDIAFKHIGKADTRLPSSMEVAFFRLVQESLTNVIKHAKARRAEVKLEYRPDFILLNITDDGIGFEVDDKAKKGYGLLGIQERVKLLQGVIDIKSDAKNGTRLMIKVPHIEQ